MTDLNQTDKDLIRLAIENNPCGTCRVLKLPACKCKKGEGKDIDKSSSSHDDSSRAPDNSSNNNSQPASQEAAINTFNAEFDKTKALWIQSELISEKKITNEVGLLAFEYDKLRGNITLQCKPNLSKKEIDLVHQFFKKIKFEFEQFKDQLNDQGVRTHDFTAVIKEDDLTKLAIEIHLPRPHYHAFLLHLNNNNLLPTPNPWEKKKEKSEEATQETTRKLSSPFGNIKEGPKPTGY